MVVTRAVPAPASRSGATASSSKVPLLFTGSLPTKLTDSVFRAELFHNCRPESAYKISIRDGMPHKITP